MPSLVPLIKKIIGQLRTKVGERYRFGTNIKGSGRYRSRGGTGENYAMQYVSQFRTRNTVEAKVVSSYRNDSEEQILDVGHGGIKKMVEYHVYTESRDHESG
jgi:hypothetical protein